MSRGKCGKLLCLEMENFTTVQRMRCAYQLSHLASKRKRALERQREERERKRGEMGSCSRSRVQAKELGKFADLFIYLFI